MEEKEILNLIQSQGFTETQAENLVVAFSSISRCYGRDLEEDEMLDMIKAFKTVKLKKCENCNYHYTNYNNKIICRYKDPYEVDKDDLCHRYSPERI